MGAMDNSAASQLLDDDDRWGQQEVELELTWSPLPNDMDQRIIAIIMAEAMPGETAVVAFRTKEQQLGSLFATLSIADARNLHRRLTIPAKGDPVADRFGRLTRERRDRLTTFLADARRRQARAAAGSR